ncbi:MAG: type II toxin-antitoxin system PemK/MazF family toxin [Candidatus Vogelbacteria bacterium]|nr:type II toxin-antitoxin system PemK/MazF family toxin [Candidatus Vogelbacteria bacterium]
MIEFFMKDFDLWNEVKKLLENEEEPPDKFPKEGEVWMSSLGRNIGYEQNGSGDNFSRPVLIVKKFNNHMFWVIPLSTKQKSFDFYFNYTDPNSQKVSAILAQIRLMSVKRFKRKLYDLDNQKLGEVRLKLKSFL